MSVFYNELFTDHYKDYIQKFWTLDNSGNPFYTEPKFALPNGCCTIAFISGNGITLNFPHQTVELPSGIFLAGQITHRTSVAVKPDTKAVMAQVKPWLPLLITNFPMNRLVNDVLSLEHINLNLYQNLLNVNHASPEVIATILCKKLEAYLTADPDCKLIQWVFQKLQEKGSNGQNRILDVVERSGYSQRRMEQKFKQLVGPSAKEIQRILQLRKLINDLDQLESPAHLSRLAYQHGYYDQSHFIRSYQQIISGAPSLFDASDYLLPKSGHFDFLQS